MNILFLSLFDISSLDERGIYTDLLRELRRRGNVIYCISPVERRKKQPTEFVANSKGTILRLKIGNIQKNNVIEKGISTLLLETQVVRAIKRYFKHVSFDLVLYPTPPITFATAVRFIKSRDGAISYLMIKDIFPQNSVDIGLLKQDSFIHKFFLRKERKLYAASNYIGCMSDANVRYLLKHDPSITREKVEVCPNSINPAPFTHSNQGKAEFRKKNGIREDAVVFLYGGNLGKPQGISFIIQCLEKNMNRPDRFFIICGDGTEYSRLQIFLDSTKPSNILLQQARPRAEYDEIAACCDVGLIFLDHRFTIPNFPSRLLSYLENAIPVLACTDRATDIGQVITGGGFGWWCESRDEKVFTGLVDSIIAEKAELRSLGLKGRNYLETHYTAQHSADIILKHF